MTFLIYDSRCDQLEVTYHYHRLKFLNLKCHLPKGARVLNHYTQRGQSFCAPTWDSRVSLSDVKWVPLGLASAKGDERLVPRLVS